MPHKNFTIEKEIINFQDAQTLQTLGETDELMKITEEGLPSIVEYGTCHYPCKFCGRLYYTFKELLCHMKEYY